MVEFTGRQTLSYMCPIFGRRLAKQNVYTFFYISQADVIVNTTSTKLGLNKGAVSKALLKAAGSQLQKECNRKYPNGIKHHEIAVTHAYNLNAKFVIHISLKSFHAAMTMERMKVFVCAHTRVI